MFLTITLRLFRLDAQEHFLRKSDCSFRHSINVTCKAQVLQVFEKFVLEEARTLQIGQVVLTEMYIVYIIDEMFQPGDDRIPPWKGLVR